MIRKISQILKIKVKISKKFQESLKSPNLRLKLRETIRKILTQKIFIQQLDKITPQLLQPIKHLIML